MKTILVVDDSLEIREVLSLIFGDSFRLRLAVSGYEAAEILKKGKVDLILSDFEMPNGNGFWLLNYLRKNIESEVPVVLMSGHPTMNAEEALSAGASAYLSKPFDICKLTSIVQSLTSPMN